MEKSSSKVTIISIILALICLGILGGIVYYKVHKKEETKPIENNEKTKKPEEEETPTTPEEPKENYDEIVKSLYAIIGNNPEFRNDEVVNFESLSENVRDSIVLNSLSENCEASINYDKELFNAKYKEIFNQEKTSEEGFCKVEGNNYECNRYCTEFPMKIFSKYEKYELVDGSIVIYETAGHLDYGDDSKVYLKGSAIESPIIATFDSIDDLKDSETEYQLPTYKHTFAKGDTNYYWVSSESVKQ